MNRVMDALREWTELRKRLRDEHLFHLARLTADFRALGLSRRGAQRAARRRFGWGEQRRSALRELGGDWAGLLRLFSMHRVPGSPWFPPTVLFAGIVLVLFLSPAPLAVIEGVAGRPLTAADRDAVFISQQAQNLTYVGISKADFESIRALDSLSKLAWHQSIHARAQVNKSATVAAIEALVRTKTRNRRLRVVPLFERHPIVMGPAKAAWGFVSCYALFFVVMFRRSPQWLGYGVVVGALHALASLLLWAFGIQLWNRIAWSTDGRALAGFLALFTIYLGLLVFQCHAWWRDLRRRCPFCLQSLLLPLTEGSSDCFLLNSATTESICAHGHGVLVETRWSSRFRRQQSPLNGLVHG